MPPDTCEHHDRLVHDVGEIKGKLGSLERSLDTHRREIRQDIKDGLKDIKDEVKRRMDEISSDVNGQQDRIEAVQTVTGRLINWKGWVAGIGAGILFLLGTVPNVVVIIMKVWG